jgi:hypothetical protein
MTIEDLAQGDEDYVSYQRIIETAGPYKTALGMLFS